MPRKYNTIRRCAAALLALLLAVPAFGCEKTDRRESIVCSSYVIYDWVVNVLGDDAENWSIRLLGAKGADIHSYQPTVRDIAAAAECRAFIRNGGDSETWAHRMLEAAGNDGMLELSLCDALEDKLCPVTELSAALSSARSEVDGVPEIQLVFFRILLFYHGK